MVILWRYEDVRNLQVVRTIYGHCGAIFDLLKVPFGAPVGMKEGQQAGDDLTRYITCAGDRTVRLWYFKDQASQSIANSLTSSAWNQSVGKSVIRNAYCKDMGKILFVKNNDDVDKYTYDVLKSKKLDLQVIQRKYEEK